MAPEEQTLLDMFQVKAEATNSPAKTATNFPAKTTPEEPLTAAATRFLINAAKIPKLDTLRPVC